MGVMARCAKQESMTPNMLLWWHTDIGLREGVCLPPPEIIAVVMHDAFTI